MKKIPTLFVRDFETRNANGKNPVTSEITPGLEWMFNNKYNRIIIPTLKIDGAACAIFDGIFYKRYDAKNGKPIPGNAIKCQEEPDPVTGHMPCWIPCDRQNPADKWFWNAYDTIYPGITRFMEVNANGEVEYLDGTYEAVGLHHNGNPYHFKGDGLMKHGEVDLACPNIATTPTFDMKEFEKNPYEYCKEYLKILHGEGIVFWGKVPDEYPKARIRPICKIKRTDFGYSWPIKEMK